MSVLTQDSHRRLVALLHAPLPEWAEIAEAWERGARVERRYRPVEGLSDADNPWKECERGGWDFHLGGAYTCTPNWQHPYLEYRIVREPQ